MKKLMLFTFILVLLVGTVSALEWGGNNKLTYSNSDLKVDLDNWWGLGKNYGSAELKSHPSIDYVKKVGAGSQVVMWYDFRFSGLYINGLGDIEFTDMKTEKLVERDYSFVYWGEKERNIYGKGNCNISINGTKNCERILVGTETYNDWLPYNSRDIPSSNIRIGIEVYVEIDDYIDGVWEIGGQKVSLHSVWTAELNVGLIAYYTLNGTSGAIVDSLGNNDGTNFGATRGVVGIINNSFNFTSSGSDSANLTGNINSYFDTNALTLSAWVFVNSFASAGGETVLSQEITTSNSTFLFDLNADSLRLIVWNEANALALAEGSTDLNLGQWYHIVGRYNGTSVTIFLNGTLELNIASAGGNIKSNFGGVLRMGRRPSNHFSDSLIDEVAIWNRSLSQSEITQLFNDGNAITFRNVFAPTISVFSPTNTTFAIPTIFFNATADATIGTWIVNYNGTNVTLSDINTTLEVEDGSFQLLLYANNSVSGIFGLNNSIFFTVDTAPTIKVFSPTNITFATSTIFFNATNESVSVDKWIVNYNGTNVTLPNINTTLEVEDGSFQLLLYANNSITGVFGLNDTIFFSVDTIAPSLNVTEPFGVINFQDIAENQTLKFNVSDINLDTCLLQYEGVNTTLNCATNISNFTIGTDRTLTFFANDTLGNLASQVVNWSYLVLQTSTTFNSSSFETASERFTVNVTTNGSSINAGSLTFDGTENTGAIITNPVGDNYSVTKSITIPASIGTKTHNFNLTISGKIINTTLQTQVINATNFTVCLSSPNNIPFINITFKNETLAEENINATISSTWSYSLGTISEVNKTLLFTDAVQKTNYTFCGNPSDRNFNIILNMDYNNDISQQRSFSLTTTLSNATLTQVLFLLPTNLGLFSPFKTTNINGDTIEFVSAIITRVLSGNTITVATGLTDSSGFATFFLNPNIVHTATFSKTGFADNVFSFTPTADLRTVIMGGGISISNGTIISRGTVYTISPSNSTLPNNTVVSFTFNVTSNLTSITLISMNITNLSNSELLFVSNAGVGNLSGTLNTLNNTKLFGSYIIETSEETISVTRSWIIFTEFVGDYSIFKQLTLASDNELIGDFNRLIFILAFMAGVLIFMNVGKVIETSESNIAVLLLMTWAFSVVSWLDTGLFVETTNTGINRLGQFANQYGIALSLTPAGLFFILRRLFIRIPR